MIEEKEFDLFFDDLIHLDDLEIIESKLLINCENMKSIVEIEDERIFKRKQMEDECKNWED